MDYNAQPDPNASMAASEGNSDQEKRKKTLLILLLLLFLLLFVILMIAFLRSYLEKKSTTLQNQIGVPIETNTGFSPSVSPIENKQQNSLWRKILDRGNEKSQQVISPTSVVMNDNVSVSFNYSNEVRTGDSIIVPVMVNPGNKKITTVELHLTFPENIVLQQAVSGGALPTTLSAAQINNGSLKIILGGTPSQLLDPSKPLVNLTIQAKSKGVATIRSSENTKITALTYRDYLPVEVGQILLDIK